MKTEIKNIVTLDKAIEWNIESEKFLFAENELYENEIEASIENVNILETYYEIVLRENCIRPTW